MPKNKKSEIKEKRAKKQKKGGKGKREKEGEGGHNVQLAPLRRDAIFLLRIVTT